MLNISISYDDHQFPRVEVFYNSKTYYKLLCNAPESKGMELIDYREALDFVLTCIKESDNA
jgi:hypothetical protein